MSHIWTGKKVSDREKAAKATAKVLAQRALRKVNKLEKSEEVLHKLATASITPGTTVSTSAVSAVGQGADVGQRSGNEIRLKYLKVRYHFSQSSALFTGDIGRILVVQDRENAGTVPEMKEVCRIAGVSYLPDPDICGPGKRFKILADRRLVVCHYGTTQVIGNINLKLDGVRCRYGTDASDSTAMRENGIYMMFVASENTEGSRSAFFYDYDLAYTDK